MDFIADFLGYIFIPATAVAKLINGIIYLVALGVMAWAVLQFRRIRQAATRFNSFRKYYFEAEKNWDKESLASAVSKAEYSHPWFQEKMNALRKISNDTNAAIDAVDQVDHDLRWRSYGILKFPITSFLILGLLGTIWGLQQAVSSLLPTIQGGLDLDHLKNVMIGTLLGMQTAFSTTLAGLFFSLVLGYLVSFLLKSYLDGYLANVKSFLVEYVIPVYTVLDEGQLENLVQTTGQLKNTISELSIHSERFFKPLVDSANTINQGVGQLYSAATTFVSASKSIELLSGTLESSLTNLVTKLNVIEESIAAYSRMQTDIETSLARLAEFPDKFETMVTRYHEDAKNHLQTLSAGMSETLSSLLEGMQKTTGKLADELTGLKNAATAAKQVVQESADRGAEKVIQEFESLLKDIRATNESTHALFEKMMTDTGALNQKVVEVYAGQIDKVNETIDKFVKNVHKNQDYSNKQIVDGLATWIEYNKFLAKLMSGLDKLPAEIARSVKDGNGKSGKRGE
ncbi:MAG TPA: MotA/TolQ/ExbB proton channel family protein [bacterium]|nr:MotA/TolQ/ExbB proton channel family protein [bacterium]